ncbi:hypothetical protein MGG_16253 [Pyricularia oryzae 70-15]|uniref:Uncharacterized protein n=1 Tax=Pyricularia oryzae (strain 70-15 / ATCC MYA-4617 / FGSC 8958) TaxID=242507 RepID=G4MPV3_PYRO7|nr:uncharacterized protein MGG_16253 [Pyricularia oryzae 70-15]EHA57250.1 hypothetical protein MGG_16253 [Pyricularia oryzae 70-15]
MVVLSFLPLPSIWIQFPFFPAPCRLWQRVIDCMVGVELIEGHLTRGWLWNSYCVPYVQVSPQLNSTQFNPTQSNPFPPMLGAVCGRPLVQTIPILRTESRKHQGISHASLGLLLVFINNRGTTPTAVSVLNKVEKGKLIMDPNPSRWKRYLPAWYFMLVIVDDEPNIAQSPSELRVMGPVMLSRESRDSGTDVSPV